MSELEEERKVDKDKEHDRVMSRLQRHLVITCLFLVIAILCIKVMEVFTDLIHILAISVFVTYTVIGLVDYLDRVFKKRVLAVLSVYLVGVLVSVFSVLLILPTIILQIGELIKLTASEVPQLIRNSGDWLKPLEQQLAVWDIHVKTDEIAQGIVQSLPQFDGTFIVAQMSGVAIFTMTFAVYSLSVLVLYFYFLLEGKSMTDSAVSVFPDRWRDTLISMSSEINTCLQAFFRGQIVLGLLFGVFMVLVYMAMGVEYALALGLLLGVWEIVPVIGPTIGFIPALISVSFLGMANVDTNRVGEIIVLIVVFNVMQWIKDNIVAPRYIGDAIGLHPVLIFIAIMVGARLDGILGIICSLPVAGVIAVLFRFLTKNRPKDRSNSRDQALSNEGKDDETVSVDEANNSDNLQKKKISEDD